MKENRLAREESLQRREELIQQLEHERLTQRQEREQQEGDRTARMQDINAQVWTEKHYLVDLLGCKVWLLDVFN